MLHPKKLDRTAGIFFIIAVINLVLLVSAVKWGCLKDHLTMIISFLLLSFGLFMILRNISKIMTHDPKLDELPFFRYPPVATIIMAVINIGIGLMSLVIGLILL